MTSDRQNHDLLEHKPVISDRNDPKHLIYHPGIRVEHCVTRVKVMHCAKNNRPEVNYTYTAVYSKLENQYQVETITAVKCTLFIMLFIMHNCK